MKKKNLLKNLLRVSIVLLLCFLSFFVVKKLTKKEVEQGLKTINLTIQVEQDIIYQKTVKTAKTTLGDLLDELNNKDLNITFSGEKDGIYGRSIMIINNYSSDWNLGPWWFIESDNNKDALELGFCNGCDLQNIYDNDNFVLILKSSY